MKGLFSNIPFNKKQKQIQKSTQRKAHTYNRKVHHLYSPQIKQNIKRIYNR